MEGKPLSTLGTISLLTNEGIFFPKIKLPDSNVITGARTAISVNLANNALYDKSLCIGMMAIIYLNRRLKRE